MNHDARVTSIGHQLLNHGVGVVSEQAARKIAEKVPGPVRDLDGQVLVDIVRELATSGEIVIHKVGDRLALE